LYQTCKELKINYFDREQLAKVFDKSHIFFSFFLFINNFEIYRNMYRILKKIYFISIYFSYNKRRKLINVFTLILEFYKTTFYDVIEVFRKLITNLDNNLKIKINEET